MSIWEPFSDNGSYLQNVFIGEIHCLRTCSYKLHKIYMIYGNRFVVSCSYIRHVLRTGMDCSGIGRKLN